ncbi:MAG TPA: hypothetical protein VLL98_00895 [Rickettsiales bacterium]|nr:hypothetical protein [Rickettsiales bacterium]
MLFKLPRIIIVIGTSCSGKSSFIESIQKYKKNYYQVLDDVKPLYKIFSADKLLNSNKYDEFKEYLFANNLNQYYSCNKNYSIKDGDGYKIINPKLWNIVLDIINDEILINKNYIIEFSRGDDKIYNKFYKISKREIYLNSLKILLKNKLSNNNDILIINIKSHLNTRIKRNYIRYNNNGHFVSEQTMNTIYKNDCFNCDFYDRENGAFNINNKKIPVYRFYNKNQKSRNAMNIFFIEHLKKALEYFNQIN